MKDVCCPDSGTKQAQLGSALALQAAFADIGIHKSRSVYYWLKRRKEKEARNARSGSRFYYCVMYRSGPEHSTSMEVERQKRLSFTLGWEAIIIPSLRRTGKLKHISTRD